MDNNFKKGIVMPHKRTFIISVLLLALMLYTLVACGKSVKREEEESKLKIQQELELKEKQRLEMEKKLQEENENRVKQNVTLQGTKVGGLSKEEVLKIINQKASSMEKKSENAKFDATTWTITSGKMGTKVKVQETLQQVLDADEGEDVKLMVQEIAPEITKDSLKNEIVEIAKCTTPIVDNSESRVKNIELAIDKINNIILAPKEEFSFNKVVGNRTEGKGYEYAPIIIKTEEGPKKANGVGGGVCQLSTTIFNAVEEGGLKVTERHAHSSDVTYVSEGEDAAVSYGSIDFKFINNRKYPIMLKISVSSKQLTVMIIENRK